MLPVLRDLRAVMLMAWVMHCAISKQPMVGVSQPYPAGGRARLAMFIISSRNWGDCVRHKILPVRFSDLHQYLCQ